MTDKAWVRPSTATVLPAQDVGLIKAEIERTGAKTVLEFGPGESTELFLSLGLKVTSCENIDKWLEVAQERFKDRVRVLKFDDEMPVVVHGLDDNERFDLAFVDAPKGFNPERKRHPGYEDCSRFNSCLFALQRCSVVLLHDAARPLEKGTLGRLNGMGYEFEQLNSSWGLARITHGRSHSTDLPRIEESGSPAPGPDSIGGGVSEPIGPDRLDASGTGKKGRGVRRRRRPARGPFPTTPSSHPGVESSS